MSELQVIARYTIREGEESAVVDLIRELVDATRREAGNISYDAYRAVDDERSVVLLERYVSPEAFEVHRASEHFQRLAMEGIVPRLQSRVVETFAVNPD